MGIILFFLITKFSKKLEETPKETFNGIWKSFLITLPLQLVLIALFSFFSMPSNCQQGVYKVSLSISPYTSPVIFLVVLFEYYLLKLLKSNEFRYQ
jgi:hypothetical protein